MLTPPKETLHDLYSKELVVSMPMAYKRLVNPVFGRIGKLTCNFAKKIEIKRKATKFVVLKDVLYWRSLDGILLRCISNHETYEAMSKINFVVCSAHQSRPKL